jgi:hypothetical protein
MNIEIFTICEYAQTLGKILNVISPFDTISANKLPVAKSFSIALRIRYEPEGESEKEIVYTISDPDEVKIFGDIKAKATIMPHVDKTKCIDLVVNIESMVFDKSGKYRIAIETEGEKYEVPLYVELKNK